MSGKMYQVQNGQKVDITPQVATLSTGTRRNVGELVHSLVPLDDAGLHLLDGSLLATTGVYAEGVAAIIALRPNHPYLFTSETMWQQSVSQYGVCGKFVYDAGAGTLRLPKVTGHIAATIDLTAIGDLIEAGLPNITGLFRTTAYLTYPAPSGAFSIRNVAGKAFAAGNAYDDFAVNFNAANESPIYGNSTTVQPQAIKGFLYMVLANRPKTPIQVDIDNIAADLALKADVSLGNVNSTGQAAMAHAAMPSGQYFALPVPANGGALSAPADGYLALQAINSSNVVAYAGMYGAGIATKINVPVGSGSFDMFLPVKAGATYIVVYTNITVSQFFFVYANGSAPQP